MNTVPKGAKAIFLEAIEKHDFTERNNFLSEACVNDSGLRRRVEELLSSFDEAEDFMEDKPVAVFAPTVTREPVTERPGSVIGPYKLLQQIGEGGFGVVYMAEQTKPVRRKVALKIIKPGMDTKEVIARFEAERQALALMDHPNIAKVFDAGATDSGRPYFVMELVKGIPLIEFCDDNHLSTLERLEIFVTVCRAIQHAHHKGIIHRDLKPSNVMVTLHDNKPVPKVIDFGVSKALSQQLTEKTLFTAYGQMIGTPVYMSPEQAQMSGLDVDTRSDIYSLGVLLYELLTGSTPLDAQQLRDSGYAEMQRLIREEEAPKPSLRLSSHGGEALARIARHHNTEPKKLSQFLRGDLDWIVMRALEKERNRRYDTANSFAADIERFLKDEAVEACPPSAFYFLRKYARRHKTALATAAMVTIALIAGIIGTTWQAILATHERDRAVNAEAHARAEADRANNEADRANEEAVRANNEAIRANKEAQNAKTEAEINQAVLDFVNNDLLGQADPHAEPDRNLKLITVFNRASEKIEGRFNGQPETEASIRLTLGETLLSLGNYEASRKHLERALELNRAQHGNEHPETLHVWTSLAWLEHRQANYKLSETLLNQIVMTARRGLGQDDAITLDAMGKLADIHRHLGNLSAAESLFHETIAAMRRVLGPEHLQTLRCRNNLSIVLAAQDRLDEAMTLRSDVLAVCRRVLGSDHPLTITSIANLSVVFRRQRRYAEAETLGIEALNRSRRVFGPEHPSTLNSMARLATIAAQQGRDDEAQSLRRKILDLRNRVLGPAHPYTLATLNQLTLTYRRHQQFGQAEQLYREQIQHLKQLIAETPDDYSYRLRLAELYSAFGRLHKMAGRLQEATSCFEQACEHFKEVPEQERGVADWGHFGQALYRAGRYKEARVALEKVIALRGDEGPNMKLGPRWWYMVMTLHQLGETELARSYFNQLSDEVKKQEAAPDWQTRSLDEAVELLGIKLEPNEPRKPPPKPESPTSQNDALTRKTSSDTQF